MNNNTPLLLYIFINIIMVGLYCASEKISFVDSVYLVTAMYTTVGYGDVYLWSKAG